MSSSATVLARVGTCVVCASTLRLLLLAFARTLTLSERVDLHLVVIISTRPDPC